MPFGIRASSNLYGIEGFHLKDVLGVDPRRAGAVSRMIHGAIVGAAISCHHGEASPDDLEDLLVDLIRSVMV